MILLFKVSIDFDSIFDLYFNIDIVVTKVYKFSITAQHYNAGSA